MKSPLLGTTLAALLVLAAACGGTGDADPQTAPKDEPRTADSQSPPSDEPSTDQQSFDRDAIGSEIRILNAYSDAAHPGGTALDVWSGDPTYMDGAKKIGTAEFGEVTDWLVVPLALTLTLPDSKEPVTINGAGAGGPQEGTRYTVVAGAGTQNGNIGVSFIERDGATQDFTGNIASFPTEDGKVALLANATGSGPQADETGLTVGAPGKGCLPLADVLDQDQESPNLGSGSTATVWYVDPGTEIGVYDTMTQEKCDGEPTWGKLTVPDDAGEMAYVLPVAAATGARSTYLVPVGGDGKGNDGVVKSEGVNG